jgi:hypothetical protein
VSPKCGKDVILSDKIIEISSPVIKSK